MCMPVSYMYLVVYYVSYMYLVVSCGILCVIHVSCGILCVIHVSCGIFCVIHVSCGILIGVFVLKFIYSAGKPANLLSQCFSPLLLLYFSAPDMDNSCSGSNFPRYSFQYVSICEDSLLVNMKLGTAQMVLVAMGDITLMQRLKSEFCC